MVDPMLGIRAVPTAEQRGILAMNDSSTLLLIDENENPSWQVPIPGLEYDNPGPKNTPPETSGYQDLSDSEDEDEVVRPSPGIPIRDLFRSNPDYLSLRPLDIINPDSIVKFYNETVKSHLCVLLCKYFPAAMRSSVHKLYKLKTYFQVPIEKAEIFTIPTLDIGESTIDGNVEILERLV